MKEQYADEQINIQMNEQNLQKTKKEWTKEQTTKCMNEWTNKIMNEGNKKIGMNR